MSPLGKGLDVQKDHTEDLLEIKESWGNPPRLSSGKPLRYPGVLKFCIADSSHGFWSKGQLSEGKGWSCGQLMFVGMRIGVVHALCGDRCCGTLER